MTTQFVDVLEELENLILKSERRQALADKINEYVAEHRKDYAWATSTHGAGNERAKGT